MPRASRTPASRPGTGRSATPTSRPGTRGSDKAPLQGWEGLFHEPRSAKSVSFAKTAAEDTPKRKGRPRSVRFSLPDTPEAVVRPVGASSSASIVAVAPGCVAIIAPSIPTPRIACATRAYDRTMHAYNTPPQRAVAHMLLHIVPDRDALTACYGFDDFDELAPVFTSWLRAARPVCDALDAFFDAHPELKTPQRR